MNFTKYEDALRAIPSMTNGELIDILQAVATELEARMNTPPREIEYPLDGDGHRMPF